MIQNLLFSKTIAPLAGKALDAYALRHKAIANNIANIEVPHYNRIEVKFEDTLRQHLQPNQNALWKTHEKHLPDDRDLNGVPSIVEDKTNPKLNAINNVDVDMEMADMSKNQLSFNLISSALKMEYSRIRMAIRGQ